MSGFFDPIVQRVSSFTTGDIVAVICFFLAASFAVTMVKTAFRIIGGCIAFLAVLYLCDPGIYSVSLNLLDQFWNAICSVFSDIHIGDMIGSLRI